MSLELPNQIGRIGLSCGANTTFDHLNHSSYLLVPIKEVHVTAHIGLARAAHHSVAHHSVAGEGLQRVSQQEAAGSPHAEQGTTGSQQTDHSAACNSRHS